LSIGWGDFSFIGSKKIRFFVFGLVPFAVGQFNRLAFTLSPAAAGALPKGEPWGVFFFFVFGLVRFAVGQLKRLAFTLSPAAAGALPVGEPWGGFSFLFLGWFVL